MPRGPSRPSATPVSRGRRLGIDTGGTFTAIVAIDEATGEIVTTKTPSTPHDPSVGVLDGIRKILRLVDNAAAAASRPAVAAVSHGTTVATNALLQERFPGLGLVTTQGFRHVLEIARQAVPRGYGNSYFWVKPERIVPLHLVREVPERLNFRGEELRPLDEASVRAAARFFRQRGVAAVGICLMHSYANSTHERRVADIVREEHPDCTLS